MAKKREQKKQVPNVISIKISFEATDGTARVLDRYDSGEGAARVTECLARYGEIIRRADRELEDTLTEDEILVVAAVTQGTIWEPASVIEGGIEADLADAEDVYFAELKGGRKPLIAKVRGLTYPQQVALVERVRRIVRRGEK